TAVVEPLLEQLGAGRNPECWIAWGDDPAVRWTLLAPTPAGLVECAVRVAVPGEGPRATAKLVRWARVQVGDLAVEAQAGHRFVSIQIEGLVLKGVDAEADRVVAFVRRLLDAIDGRWFPDPEAGPAASGRARGGRATPRPRGAARAD
ncbi:MAG: hypothetical protein C4343_03060, partial [Chloroflexota bacterium]